MRSFIVSAMLMAVALGASAEIVIGNGKIETERRKLPAFRSIALSGSGTLRVHKGDRKVEVTTDSNILPYITTDVSSGELRIGFKPALEIRRPTKLVFDVTLPELSGLGVSGSGEAYVDAFSGDSFSGELSGSGGIKADLDYTKVSLRSSGSGGYDAAVKARDFRFRCSGSGGAVIEGSADSSEIELSGSGELGARDFAVGEASLRMSGSGRVELRASKSLKIVVSGSGEVRYWGNPSLSQRVSGSARISKAGD
jgi:hypothetical protein